MVSVFGWHEHGENRKSILAKDRGYFMSFKVKYLVSLQGNLFHDSGI